jgi:hypothetical protein
MVATLTASVLTVDVSTLESHSADTNENDVVLAGPTAEQALLSAPDWANEPGV